MNSKERNILLFIIISIIFIGIGFYIFKPKNNSSTTNIETNEEQKTESTSTETPKKTESPKPEVEPKISISQTRFDEIKNYILSLDDNLLPSNLNPNEKTKIEEIRTPKKPILQRRSGKIKDKQKEIDNYNDKLNEIETKKNELKPQQTKLEQNRDAKTKEIDQIKLQLKNQGKPFYNNPQVIKLQDERREIIQQIVDVENEIEDCKIEQETCIDKLNRAEKNKKELEQDYKDLSVSDEKITIIQLNKIYQITN